MAFSKLKSHLRTRAIRTIHGVWQVIGNICDLYSGDEYRNYFSYSVYI